MSEQQHPKAPKLPPKFDFELFLKQLKSKKSDPIIRYIRSFLKNFSQRTWSTEEQSKLVLDFKDFIFIKMKEFEPFKLMNFEEFENSKAGVEKLIMTKIYDVCYSPDISRRVIDNSHLNDLKLDEEISLKFKKCLKSTPKELELDEDLIN